ncbi:uncharacterized protein B0H18DRAFT_928466 [Fomitopsis serialis]|uniref:uncharacterized protein n=1 Tax=Fomitopsis serialis TaxID=139415 RepID=UPI002007637D|nr:uncharacterized protein B0H18DRAFT_928466 [Neoantrodia serialis]KAH9933457.1 hypothetical protein B0H18DRAFT_928466 [Neoantrodia serialis]
MSDYEASTSIPFSFFVSLIEHISRIKPRKASNHGNKGTSHSTSSVVQTFRNWVTELHRRYDPLPPGTTAILFRLLFPEEDAKRKYDMQEARLAQVLSGAFGLLGRGTERARGLAIWKAENAIGCLGFEVRKVLAESRGVRLMPSQICTLEVLTPQKSLGDELSVAEVDALLSTLACKSAFSADSVRQNADISTPLKDKSRTEIVRSLYSRLSAPEACVVTQIILKDIRPLLYPLPEDETHYTTLLIQYKSNALEQLSKFDAMRAWDSSGRMLSAYRVRACLDEAASAYEKAICAGKAGDVLLAPQVGIPIQIPKCSKGQGCVQSLRLLRGSKKVWAETKYDGERTQIHVDLEAGFPRITIYSKSGRDSTMDRVAIHPLILDAIGFNDSSCKVKRNVVLEAEMVAYSDTLHRIDEFWRIRSLISTTAIGPRHSRHPKHTAADTSQDAEDGSQCSLASNASDDGTRHLALVFFDILVLDDASLLSSSYSTRRATLESLLHPKPGYVMLVKRVAIDMQPSVSTRGGMDPEARLREIFAQRIADHQEGLVLKADEARYNDWRLPWVKLKKDYIEGYGDTLDLVLVGATWEKERARELRVAPTAYTTFYIGVLANSAALKTNPRCMPHFEVFFTASYGLSRQELEQLNFRIKSSDPVRCEPGKAMHGLPYTHHLFHGLPSPTVLLPEPILVEVVGGSFTKAAHSKFYELRFPRIVKVFRSSERSWTDGATLEEFQRIARESVGHESSHKDVEDWCNELWGKPSSPGAKCPVKRRRTEAEWAEKLEKADHKSGKRARKAETEHGVRPEASTAGGRENRTGALPGSPKSPRLLRTLGSMTNVMRWSPEVDMPLQHLAPGATLTSANAIPSPSPTRIHLRNAEDQRASTLTDAGSAESSDDFTTNCIPVRRVGAEQVTAGDHRVEDNVVVDAPASPPPEFTSTSLGHFLQHAVIWLAQPRSTPRPAWRVPSKLIFPPGQQVHSLESLLQACRWGTAESMSVCDWAEKGVIFVDDTAPESNDRPWTEYPLKSLMERRSTLVREVGPVACKPVWIFSMTMLSYEALSNACSDVEDRALCKFG